MLSKEKILQKRKERWKRYYSRNREKLLQKNKQYYHQHKQERAEYQKRHYQENKVYIIFRSKGYYYRNRERTLKRLFNDYWANGRIRKRRSSITDEERREYRKLWARRNKDKRNELRKVRRNGLTLELAQKIYEDNIKRYGTLTCEYCKKPIRFGNDSLDHKIPVSKSGISNYENICVACRSCNCRKNARTDTEFLKTLEV